MRLVHKIDHRWHGGSLMTIFNAFQGKYQYRLWTVVGFKVLMHVIGCNQAFCDNFVPFGEINL
jgi:hypothetical protein